MVSPTTIFTCLEEDKYLLKEQARFLLIDDDLITCFVCKKIIEKAFRNITVQTFNSPSRGLDYLEECNKMEPLKTVLFLDIHMPIINGWDVLKQIENFNEDFKSQLLIVILSSSIAPADIKRAKTNPLVAEYFRKPLDEEHLEKLMKLMELVVM